MRIRLALLTGVALLPPRASVAQSLPPCAQCIPVTTASPTSLAIVALFGAGGVVPNASTAHCRVEYRWGAMTLHSAPMAKSGSAFSGTIYAIPPTTTVHHRVVCDGSAGSFYSAQTSAAATSPPTPPTVIAATRVAADKVTFSFTGDPSEPTVFWEENQGAAGKWFGSPDLIATFSQKTISIVGSGNNIRLGVRNSAGTVYSPVVP